MQKKNSTNGFSERLVSLMQEKELTLAQIASAVGKSSPSVHRWTRGGEIDYDNLRALANFLEVNWIWLRYGDDAINSIEDSQLAQNSMGDIRKKYLSDIMESEARMKTALEMARIVTWELNILTGQLILSDNAAAVFGVEPESIRKELLPFENLQLEDLVLKFYDNSPYNWDFKLQPSTEITARWFTSRGMIVKDSAGRPSKLFGISADITDRKKAEQDLEYSELMMRNMIDIIPVGLCGADKFGHIHLLNPEVQRIWGGAKFVGLDNYGEYKGWKEGSEIELGAKGWSLARAVKYGEATDKEVVNIEAFDGKKRTIIMYAKPLLDSDNNIIGAIEVNQDITEIKAIEKEYKEAHRNWEAIFNQSEIGIIKLSTSNKISDLNKRASQEINLDRKDALNKGIESIFDKSTLETIQNKISCSNNDSKINTHKISGILKRDDKDISKSQKIVEFILFVDNREENNPITIIIFTDIKT